MAYRIARDPFDLSNLFQPDEQRNNYPVNVDPNPNQDSDPNAGTNWTGLKGLRTNPNVNTMVDANVDPNNDSPGGGGAGGGGTSVPNTPCAPGYKKDFKPDGSFECVPATAPNKDCPQGYEWEQGDPTLYPNGRCKIAGKTWEESQGQVAPGYGNKDQGNAGGAGGSGGGGGSAKAPASQFDLTKFFNLLDPIYANLYNKIGTTSLPYTPEVIAALMGNAKLNSERSKVGLANQLQAQRSAAGMGLQGNTQQGLRQIAADADQAYGATSTQIASDALKANYAAEVQKINDQIQALNSRANFMIGLAGSDNQKQSIQMQYATQMASLQNQLKMLQMNLDAQLQSQMLDITAGKYGG